jgi:hypothetical protein
MDYGLALSAVITLFLDDRRPVNGLAFLDDGAIAIPVIVILADGYACANGPDVNANVIRPSRRRHRADGRRNQQILSHHDLLSM